MQLKASKNVAMLSSNIHGIDIPNEQFTARDDFESGCKFANIKGCHHRDQEYNEKTDL